METIEQRKQKALAEMVEQAEKQPSKEIKTSDFILVYSSTCFGFNGYYITDKMSKWCELFAFQAPICIYVEHFLVALLVCAGVKSFLAPLIYYTTKEKIYRKRYKNKKGDDYKSYQQI